MSAPEQPILPLSLEDQIDALLPQTQCTRCGYPSCRDYAAAIADNQVPHNQCPPGGKEGIQRLSALLKRPILPLNPANGVEQPRTVVRIDESRCIGCTLCLQACPVDAIIGAPKRMHTVLTEACTGCDLCIAPCPVDCIEHVTVSGTATGWEAWSEEQAQEARRHHLRRQKRLIQQRAASDLATSLEEQARRKAELLAAAQQRAGKTPA